MGQTSSSTSPPKEDPDLLSSFGTNLQNFKLKTKILSQELIAYIESSLEEGNLRETVSAISNALGDIEKAPLNIAVIGEVGAGKSSLINALQGVRKERKKADEEGAAATGVVCTTTERTPYSYAKFPSVTLWDMPGITFFALQPYDYLKKINFEEYDFFIIVSSGHHLLNDTLLAKAIVQMKRRFYFVLTHIDTVLTQIWHNNFYEGNKLERIHYSISSILKVVTNQEPPLFLVSNFDVSNFDFPKLETTLLRELTAYNRHMFMLTLSNVTDSTIDRKRDMLKQKILKESIMPRATVPFRGLTQNDLEMLEQTLNDYRSSFGLDEASLENIAEDLHMTLEELKANIKSPHLFSDEPDTSLTDKLLKYIRNPFFLKVFQLQNYFIDTVASDVKIILSKEELLTEKVSSFNSNASLCWEEFLGKISVSTVVPESIHFFEMFQSDSDEFSHIHFIHLLTC